MNTKNDTPLGGGGADTKIPNDFGKQVMEFSKITMDAYRSGSLVGQIKVLEELKIEIQHKIDKFQNQYDQTEVGSVLKRVKDGQS